MDDLQEFKAKNSKAYRNSDDEAKAYKNFDNFLSLVDQRNANDPNAVHGNNDLISLHNFASTLSLPNVSDAFVICRHNSVRRYVGRRVSFQISR